MLYEVITPDASIPLFEAFAEQHEPRIEVLGLRGKAQCRVEPQFPRGELRASGP